MSWLPLKITKEELAKQEAELRANRGNVPLVDESKLDSAMTPDVEKWFKQTEKALKGAKK